MNVRHVRNIDTFSLSQFQIKHELEISIPTNGARILKNDLLQQECTNYLQPHDAVPMNVAQATEPNESCFNAYTTMAVPCGEDIMNSGRTLPVEQEDDLSYDDFVGIPTTTLEDHQEMVIRSLSNPSCAIIFAYHSMPFSVIVRSTRAGNNRGRL